MKRAFPQGCLFFLTKNLFPRLGQLVSISLCEIYDLQGVLAAITLHPCTQDSFHHDTFYKCPPPSFSSLLITILILSSDQSCMTSAHYLQTACPSSTLVTHSSLHNSFISATPPLLLHTPSVKMFYS